MFKNIYLHFISECILCSYAQIPPAKFPAPSRMCGSWWAEVTPRSVPRKPTSYSGARRASDPNNLGFLKMERKKISASLITKGNSGWALQTPARLHQACGCQQGRLQKETQPRVWPTLVPVAGASVHTPATLILCGMSVYKCRGWSQSLLTQRSPFQSTAEMTSEIIHICWI